MLLTNPLLPLVFLLSSLLSTACSTAFLKLGKFKSKEFLQSPKAPFFFFLTILKKCFPKQEWENLHFYISLSKHIFQLAYAVTAFFFLVSFVNQTHQIFRHPPSPDDWLFLSVIGGSIIGISVFLDYIVRLLANVWSKSLLRIAAPFASISLICVFPMIGPLLYLTRGLLHKVQMTEEAQFIDKTKLREFFAESDIHRLLDPTEQKLIASFVNFKERVAKEIMVPRVDLFALSNQTTIREATKTFAKESYSRIPIYQETLDQITGVVLYKDLLKFYTDPEYNLDAPLSSIAKPVLYSPENKKIAQLLQEFRNQQIHMAIIVDEYGGTEGIVTIEDILEELVGQIEDEYDIEGHRQFWEASGGGWIVDAKMSIIDIEDQLGIHIPPRPEYETIGGYIFHYAGTIPEKGWLLSHDNFDLEILASNERSIKKIKITPRHKNSIL